MYGPMPHGHWTRTLPPRNERILERGALYRVTHPFRDYDGHEHPIGETWTFLGSAFAPHDEGLSWFVSLDGDQEWHIRMRLTPDDQERIVDAIASYVQRVSANG
jgi:hypothetical protein